MTGPSPPRIAVVAAETEAAQQALEELCDRYPCVPPERAQVIVPLGGDGFMLETLHRFLSRGVPIFGMHRGSVGFLMNPYRADGLVERLAAAQPVVLHPLEMNGGRRAGHLAPCACLQRGLAAAREPAGGKIADQRRWGRADRRADGGRNPGCNAGRQHRLQPLGARPDYPARCRRPRTDPDQRFPPAPLARCTIASPSAGQDRGARDRQTPGQRGRRLSPRCAMLSPSMSMRTATSR